MALCRILRKATSQLAQTAAPLYDAGRGEEMEGVMDLGLDLRDLARPGRKPVPIAGSVVRELRREDLEMLAAPSGEEAPVLRKLSERHHALARALASGMKEGESAAMLGFSLVRVSILKASPAFKELLSVYSDRHDLAFADAAERLAGLSKDAILELTERLEDAPEKITTGQLVEIAKFAADRSGHGPTSTQVVSVDLGARLKEARLRASLARGEVIDVTSTEAVQDEGTGRGYGE